MSSLAEVDVVQNLTVLFLSGRKGKEDLAWGDEAVEGVAENKGTLLEHLEIFLCKRKVL